MKLTKFEQSGMLLETTSGFTLMWDIGSYTALEKLAGINPDSMLVSHIHGDHFSLECIKALSPKVLYLNEECIEAIGVEPLSSEIMRVKAGDELLIDDIKVTAFDVDHGPNVKLRPKENFGLFIEADGKTVYFAGDMFYESGIEVSNLEADVVLVPVGGFYTFGPKEAIEFIKKFKRATNIVPIHYDNAPEKLGEFLALAEKESLPIDDVLVS